MFVQMGEEEDDGDWEGAEEALQYGLMAAPKCSRISLRTLPVWVENPLTGEGCAANAMLDDGCTSAALLSRALATKLKLKGEMRTTKTEGVGGVVTEYQTMFSTVKIAHLVTRMGRVVPAQVMERPAGTYEPVDWTQCGKEFQHLEKLPLLAPVAGGVVDVMIGNSFPGFMTSLKEVVGTPGEPVARLTRLGWTVAGPTTKGLTIESWEKQQMLYVIQSVPLQAHFCAADGTYAGWEEEKLVCFTQRGPDKQLVKLLQRMLQVEDPDDTEVLSPQEVRILQQAKATLELVDGRYRIGCTWASDERPPLGLDQARQRLNSLRRSKYFKDEKNQTGVWPRLSAVV